MRFFSVGRSVGNPLGNPLGDPFGPGPLCWKGGGLGEGVDPTDPPTHLQHKKSTFPSKSAGLFFFFRWGDPLGNPLADLFGPLPGSLCWKGRGLGEAGQTDPPTHPARKENALFLRKSAFFFFSVRGIRRGTCWGTCWGFRLGNPFGAAASARRPASARRLEGEGFRV